MAICEPTYYVLVQQKLDLLVAFTSSVLHRSVQPESDIHTGVPGHLCVVNIFIQFVYPFLCRDSFTRSTLLLPVTIVLSTGYDTWLGSHTHRTFEVTKLCCVLDILD